MFWLEGETLETLDRRKPFSIERRGEAELVVVPESSQVERRILRTEIEGAFNQLWLERELSLRVIREQHSRDNATYVAALLARLDEIDYLTKPIRLIWRG
jgi:hypothetical protein